MIYELLLLGGYGQFVWPAFLFTLFCTFGLYLNTKKELQRNEKIFFEKFYRRQSIHIKVARQNKTSKKVLSRSRIF